MVAFGVFALILVFVYWINSAVRLFDQLIGDGQSARVFLEMSALTLPNVVRLMLPVAAFVASVYTVNRLASESELVVLQAAGFSAFRLARPILFFGLIVAVLMSLLSHVLVPASKTRLEQRQAEINANVTARFLTEGQFLHPSDGVTLFISRITPLGEMRDLFLSDAREPGQRTTFTARRAMLVRDESGPKLVMFDGMAQRLGLGDRRLSVTRFSDFAYDISALIKADTGGPRDIEAMPTLALLFPTEAAMAQTGDSRAAFLYEGHARVAGVFMPLAAALLGFAPLFLGGFSRFGLGRQILGAVVLLILLQLAANAAQGLAVEDARLWALAYLPPLGGILVAAGVIWLAERPRHRTAGAAVPA